MVHQLGSGTKNHRRWNEKVCASRMPVLKHYSTLIFCSSPSEGLYSLRSLQKCWRCALFLYSTPLCALAPYMLYYCDLESTIPQPSLHIRVHEIFGHVRRTVFLGDFAWWVEIPSFIFLRCWEVVGAPLAFLVSRPPDFTAKSRDSEIASTLTPKRTPSFAARWLNSSQKFLLCSKKQQNFRDLKNIASSPRYGDFSERGP